MRINRNNWDTHLKNLIYIKFSRKLIALHYYFMCCKYTSFLVIFVQSIILKMINDIDAILVELRKFNQERDWDQFHNGKDLAIAISIEAGELLEAFLWKSPENVKVEKIREELADVLNYSFQMADRYDLDIKEIMLEKIRKNAEKYPADKAKGSAKKYNEF